MRLMQRHGKSKFLIVVVSGLFFALLFSKVCFAQNYEQHYFLVDGPSTYRLTLSTTHSLFEYYQQKNHQLTQNNFASFVTPYALALVAEDIRSLFPNDEAFVNSVLMVVHQIPYQIVEEPAYPVETIIENRGDCDLFSFLAASLIESQDLDVVLLYYEHESHLNIGVSLQNPPRDARSTITYVDYGGTRYYMAECTGGDWQNGWRIGECPPELEGAQITVVTLEDCEEIAPGQVSSSFGTTESSAISLSASSNIVMEGNDVVISGRISISNSTETVMLYAATGGRWFPIGAVKSNSNGLYMFTWRPTLWGQYHLKASWSGNDEYAGADSQTISVYVVPKSLVFIGGGFAVLTILAVVMFLMYKATHPKEVQTFEEPPQYV